MSIHWKTLDGQGKVEAIRMVWERGASASVISAQLPGTTRNAIIGVYNRYPDKLKDIPLQGRFCPAIRPKPKAEKKIVLKKTRKPLPQAAQYVEEQQLVGKPLTMLQARECKWPVNDAAERVDQHLFCGLATAEGPYCQHHAYRAVPHKEGNHAH